MTRGGGAGRPGPGAGRPGAGLAGRGRRPGRGRGRGRPRGHSAMDEPSLLRRRGLQVSPRAGGSATVPSGRGKLRPGAGKAGSVRWRLLPASCPARFARDGKGGVSVRRVGKLRLGPCGGEKELQGPRTTSAGGAELQRVQPLRWTEPAAGQGRCWQPVPCLRSLLQMWKLRLLLGTPLPGTPESAGLGFRLSRSPFDRDLQGVSVAASPSPRFPVYRVRAPGDRERKRVPGTPGCGALAGEASGLSGLSFPVRNVCKAHEGLPGWV